MTDRFELPIATRHYVCLDRPPAPRCIVIGFHGYAEDTDAVLAAMRAAAIDGAVLVAPLGPHHFYNREGQVVASWMTRFERQAQIDQMLDLQRQAVGVLREDYPSLPMYCLGFSQGAAAAYRMAVLSGVEIRRLFVLAGDMPPEVQAALGISPPVATTLFWGEQDTRVGLDVMERDLGRLRGSGWPAELVTIPGDHTYLPAEFDRIRTEIEADL